jgi:hypothetical protein
MVLSTTWATTTVAVGPWASARLTEEATAAATMAARSGGTFTARIGGGVVRDMGSCVTGSSQFWVIGK